MRRCFGWVVGVLAILVLASTAGCSALKQQPSSTISTSTNPTVTDVGKPNPVIESVDATTSGMNSAYYAILEITVQNQGSDGTILVQATVTQAGKTTTNQMVTNIDKNTTQELNLVFPLVWQGGTWTETVQASIP